MRGLGVEVEVLGERRVVIETHLLGAGRRFCRLENFRGIDIARLRREFFIDGCRRFVNEPAHRAGVVRRFGVVAFGFLCSFVIFVEDPPLDACVLDSDIRTGEFVECF